jgi:hypothetical protein
MTLCSINWEKRPFALYPSSLLYCSQPFGPWPLSQFLNPRQSRYDSLDGGSARRKAATHTQNNTNTEYTYTDIRASSGIQSYDPSVRADEDGSRLRPRGHCDPLFTSSVNISWVLKPQYRRSCWTRRILLSWGCISRYNVTSNTQYIRVYSAGHGSRRSKAWTVFARAEVGTVGSNPSQGMYV